MLLSERLVTLVNWLDELPTNLIRERPSLLALQGALLCAQGDGQSAMKLLDQAILELQKTKKFPNWHWHSSGGQLLTA